MKNELHRVGLLGSYAGINMTAISSAKKVQGQLLVPDKRIFGVSGIVGNLDMKGEIHVYEDEDNHNERIHLMFKDFTYVQRRHPRKYVQDRSCVTLYSMRCPGYNAGAATQD